MECNVCGKAVDGEAVFCGFCGNKIEKKEKIKKCENCDNLLEDEASFCQICGTKAINDSLCESMQSDNNMGSSGRNEEQKPGEKIIHILGKKRISRFARNINTKMVINDKAINISTVFSLFRKKEYNLKTQEISGIKIKTVPNISAVDIIRILLMALLTVGSLIIGLTLLSIGFLSATLLFIWLAFTRAMIIELKSGNKIMIPIVNDKDVKEFYDYIGYDKSNLSGKVSKVNLIFWIWFIITSSLIGVGVDEYRHGSFLNKNEEVAGKNEESKQENQEEVIQEVKGEETPLVDEVKESEDSQIIKTMYSYMGNWENISLDPSNGVGVYLNVIFQSDTYFEIEITTKQLGYFGNERWASATISGIAENGKLDFTFQDDWENVGSGTMLFKENEIIIERKQFIGASDALWGLFDITGTYQIVQEFDNSGYDINFDTKGNAYTIMDIREVLFKEKELEGQLISVNGFWGAVFEDDRFNNTSYGSKVISDIDYNSELYLVLDADTIIYISNEGEQMSKNDRIIVKGELCIDYELGGCFIYCSEIIKVY